MRKNRKRLIINRTPQSVNKVKEWFFYRTQYDG